VVVGKSPMASSLVDLARAIGWDGDLVPPGDTLPDAPGAAVVVASQGHGDEEILLAAARHAPPYLGLVSSRKRGEVVLDYLRAHGVPDAVVESISVPAGIDLGPTSHREMAASILAELVALRAAGGLGTPAVVERSALPATAIDPVCGMEVTADESSRPFEYEGETYYFCCPGCRASFAADPDAYLRSIHADQE
jgi:xanthine dehydrogenase accessory factor